MAGLALTIVPHPSIPVPGTTESQPIPVSGISFGHSSSSNLPTGAGRPTASPRRAHEEALADASEVDRLSVDRDLHRAEEADLDATLLDHTRRSSLPQRS